MAGPPRGIPAGARAIGLSLVETCAVTKRSPASVQIAPTANDAAGQADVPRTVSHGCSAAAVGFKKSNNFGALLSGGEAAIRLHLVTGHHLVGISDEAIKRRLIPCQIGILHGT